MSRREIDESKPSFLPTSTNSGISTLEIDNLLSSCAIQNVNDWSKRIYFDLDGITSSESRVLTVPDNNFTIVGTDISQIITNKYVDCNQNTVVNIGDINVKNNASINVTKLGTGNVNNTELSYLNSARSNIQNQIDNHVSATVAHGVKSDIVGVSDNQVLSNKTLTDTLNFYQNEKDNSKKVKFDVSNVSPATTRVVTFPDSNLVVVGTELEQTLKNKTISTEFNKIYNIADENVAEDAKINANKIADGRVSNVEFEYLNGVDGPIQDQIDNHLKSTSCHGVSGVVVGTTDQQTLSNKSFSSQVNMNNNKITNLSTPTEAFDAVNKQYVDGVASGLDIKNSVRVASTVELGNEPSVKSVNYSNLTSPVVTFGTNLVIDGVKINNNDRILLKNQSNSVLNGLWVVKISGTIATLTRPSDFINVDSGSFMFVEEGDVNKNSGWVLTTPNPITIGTTGLTFTQFSGAGQLITGNGLSKSGNRLDVVGSETILSSENGVFVNSSNIANQILLSSGNANTSAVFGKLPLSDSNAVSGILNFVNGGTGVSKFDFGNRVIATNVNNTGLIVTDFTPSDYVNLSLEQTLSNKKLNSPIVDQIYDVNKNSILTFKNTDNAINNIFISNSQQNKAPVIKSDGKDDDIDLSLYSKGNGQIVLNGLRFPNNDGLENWFLKTDGKGNLSFGTTNTTIEVNVITKNNEKTVISSVATTDSKAYLISATIIGNRTDMGNETCGYMLNSLFKNTKESVVKVGGEKVNFEEVIAWDSNFSINGNNVEIYVVGEQGKVIEWRCVYSIVKI